MSKLLTEDYVKNRVVEWLTQNGYSITKLKTLTEQGVDIKARNRRYPIYFLIEVKGDPNPKKVKNLSSRREVSFVYALGQIVSRMNTKAKYKYGLAFPKSYKNKALKRIPWLFAKKNNLYLFFVDGRGKVEFLNWKDIKKAY